MNIIIIEDHAVRAQFLRDGAIYTLIVLVTLVSVSEITVRFRTLVRQFVVRPLALLPGGWGSGGSPRRGLGFGGSLAFCNRDGSVKIRVNSVIYVGEVF